MATINNCQFGLSFHPAGWWLLIVSPITDRSFGFAVIDDQLVMVKGVFNIYYHKVLPRHSYAIYIISAHNV